MEISVNPKMDSPPGMLVAPKKHTSLPPSALNRFNALAPRLLSLIRERAKSAKVL